jgi:hypothetical protein
MAKSQEDDIREIRGRAAAVGEVNQGLDVETMRECFAPDYLM